MSETKDEIAADRDQLRAERDRLIAENENLRGQLAASGATGRREFQASARRPFLSEGERQELAMHGQTNSPFTGERLTTEQVRAELADSPTQSEVEIPDPPATAAQVAPERERTAIEGVDYVWPSVAPGKLAADAPAAAVALVDDPYGE